MPFCMGLDTPEASCQGNCGAKGWVRAFLAAGGRRDSQMLTGSWHGSVGRARNSVLSTCTCRFCCICQIAEISICRRVDRSDLPICRIGQ
eukprot:12722322-Prorocentrum_lima.AAC.1